MIQQAAAAAAAITKSLCFEKVACTIKCSQDRPELQYVNRIHRRRSALNVHFASQPEQPA